MRSRIKPRLTYANVIASIALFAALSGGAYATHAHKVGTKDLRKGAVTTPKLSKKAVGTGKLKRGAVTPAKLAPVTERANYAAAAFVPVERSTHNNAGESVCGNFVPSEPGAENQGDLNAKLGSFLTGVELPHGAALRRLTMFANDNSDEDAHLYLVRKRIADGLDPQFDGYGVIAKTNTDGAVNNVMRAFGVPVDPPRVDNESFFYYLELVVCDAIEPFTAQVTYRHPR